MMMMLFFYYEASAQTIASRSIEPYRIEVSYWKTSNLVFPYAIKSVDRGTDAVLAQKAKGVENILQLKAGQQDFVPTNLSVITADGQLYSFLVDYAAEPAILNLSFGKDCIEQASLNGKLINEKVFGTVAEIIERKSRFLNGHTKEQKASLYLRNIYLNNQLMWFTLKIRNQSLIDYHPDFIRFFLTDKKRSKRTAIQETEIVPMYATEKGAVNGKQSKLFVLAFTPFTVPSTQQLIIQVGEQGGGRSLLLKVNHREVLKARGL